MSEPSTDAVEHDRWLGHTVDGTYTIEAAIGEGAMGRVYRATDVRTDAAVALKILHKHLGGDPRIARRFHREAEAARRLSHPHSLEIRDFGQARDGTLFIAMELLEGEDLQTVIDHDQPFSPRRIERIMGPILAAVHEAHMAGIIHRDLKPENVVLTSRPDSPDHVTVCDFGMAKIIETEGRSTAITKDGYVCGTPEYMAPEQAKGEPLDVRADVYAAGVILYQMLTGEVPFKAETALGIITKHIMDPPTRPRARRPEWGIPRSLEKVALRALEKAPADRFDDAAAFADALRDAVSALGDDADAKLGDATHTSKPSATPSDESPAARDESSDPADIAEPPPHPAVARWRTAAVGAFVLLFGVAGWLLLAPPSARAPHQTPRRAAPGDTAAPPDTDMPSPSETRPASEPTGSQDEPTAPGHSEANEPAASEPVASEPVASEPADAPVASEPGVRAPVAIPRASAASPRDRQPTSPPPALVDPGRIALDEGRAHLLRGELEPALRRLSEAARLRPRDAAVQRELGRAAVRAGDVPRGVASYRRYLALSPDAPDRAVIERIIAQHGG